MTELPEEPLQAVIFDLDGLLVDTEPLWGEASRIMLVRRGLQPDPALRSRVMGRHPVEVARMYVAHYGLDEDPAVFLAERLETLRQVYAAHDLRLLPGARELVTALDEGRIPRAVASGSPRWLVELVLERTALQDRFDGIAGSDEVTSGKPAPDLFLLAAQRLGVRPAACIVLEDSAAGIEAALAAGMSCVAVPSPETPPAAAARAHLVVSSLGDLAPWLLRDVVRCTEEIRRTTRARE